MSNLKQKSIDGVIWTLTEKVFLQLIKLVLGVILARLLTPSDYGLVGMITIFISLSLVFIDSGFGLAYIQKQDTNENDASTIFYFNLIVSVIFYFLLWFAAPLIADFYNESQLIKMIRVMSIVLVINSFGMIQLTKLKKDVNFKKKTILLLVTTLMSSTAGIIAALNDYGVWSLVIQTISKASILTIGLWIFHKWRPKLYFNFKSLKSMFSFSSWALLMGLISSFFENIYYVVIGKFFPAAQLGFYTKAKQFQQIVVRTTSNAVGSVAFPVFSKIQEEKEKLKNAVQKFIKHTMFFVVPFVAIFFVIAKPFFLILLTEKWSFMVPYFQLLLIAGLFYPMQMVNVQVLSAIGKMKLNFSLSMIKNTLKVLNIIIMFRYGVVYIIVGEIVLSFIALIINTIYTKKFLNYGVFEQLKDVSSSLIISLILGILGMLMIDQISNDYFKVFVGVLFIASFYLIAMYYFNRPLMRSNIEIVRNKLKLNK